MRNSVRYFILFLDSLLNKTTGRFRLVSNGCSPEEQRYMAELCGCQERLEFFSIPTNSSWPHSDVLNYLQARTQDPYFGFMDSDIFAVEDFVADIEENIENSIGLFSGTPLWVKSEEVIFRKGFKFLLGRYNQTDQDLVLGNTYLAVYNNEVLSNVIQSTGVGFDSRGWHEIPGHIQSNLEELGMAAERYDTGKLLNLMLLYRHCQLKNIELSSMYHIGGAGFQGVCHKTKKGRRYRFAEKVNNRYFQKVVAQLRHYRTFKKFRKKYKYASKIERDLNFNLRSFRRNPVRHYFLHMLDAMIHEKQMPELLITGDGEIDYKVKMAKTHLMELYAARKTWRGTDGVS